MPRIGALASISRKLASADAGSVLRMFEDMGKDALLTLVGGAGSPIGIGLNAFLRYVELEEKDNFRIAREQNKPLSAAQKRQNIQRHSEWLRDNQWRFDWRSQPRRPAGTEAGGEWMDGRLDYMAEVAKPYTRREKQRAVRAMKAYKTRQREAGNMRTRPIYSKWGDF